MPVCQMPRFPTKPSGKGGEKARAPARVENCTPDATRDFPKSFSSKSKSRPVFPCPQGPLPRRWRRRRRRWIHQLKSAFFLFSLPPGCQNAIHAEEEREREKQTTVYCRLFPRNENPSFIFPSRGFFDNLLSCGKERERKREREVSVDWSFCHSPFALNMRGKS